MLSPAEKATNERLESAIRDALEARGHNLPIIIESISIVAAANFDEDGEPTTGVYYVTSGDGVPHYRLLGLLQFVETGLKAEIASTDVSE